MKTQYFHWPMTRRQLSLFFYYIELGLSEQAADSVIHTAWVYGYLDQQLP